MYFNDDYIQQKLFKDGDLLIAVKHSRINGSTIPKEAFAVISSISITDNMHSVFMQDTNNTFLYSSFNSRTSKVQPEQCLRNAYKNEVKRFVKHTFNRDYRENK